MTSAQHQEQPIEQPRQSIILGIGTGRCGTHTLAELLDRQPDARFTHEQRPLLPWYGGAGLPGIRERLQRLRRTRPQRFIGDVASFYLPYVEEAITADPNIRIIAMERSRDAVVSSFCRWSDTVHPLPIDHWAAEPAHGWYHDPPWSHIFPKYPKPESREGRIRRYWDEYHNRVSELTRRYPRNVQLFATEALNTAEGVREVLDFAGVPRASQIVLPRLRLAAVEQVFPHPRRALLQGAGLDDPRRCVVLTPYTSHIEPACEAGLRALEHRGYTVWRSGGIRNMELGRSLMATDALMQGFEETMWIDPDVKFEASAIDRLRSHQVPIVGGVYPRPDPIVPASHPLPGTPEARFRDGGGLTEVLYSTSGFLLVRHRVYMDIVQRFRLPLCNQFRGRALLPLFKAMIRHQEDGSWYLPDELSFCEAARQCGYRVQVDTGIPLWHLGPCEYGWVSGGASQERRETITLSPE